MSQIEAYHVIKEHATKDHPMTAREVAEHLDHLARKTVEKNITRLKQNGKIEVIKKIGVAYAYIAKEEKQ